MFATTAVVAILLACVQTSGANSRTCKCDIRIEDEANAPRLMGWSTQLWSCGIFCFRFPGVHVNCDEVASWCPGECKRIADERTNSTSHLREMCQAHGKEVRYPNGIQLYAYSKIMNNCGGHWDHYKLKVKLCCLRLRLPYEVRWIGHRC